MCSPLIRLINYGFENVISLSCVKLHVNLTSIRVAYGVAIRVGEFP